MMMMMMMMITIIIDVAISGDRNVIPVIIGATGTIS